MTKPCDHAPNRKVADGSITTFRTIVEFRLRKCMFKMPNSGCPWAGIVNCQHQMLDQNGCILYCYYDGDMWVNDDLSCAHETGGE